jgi:hypothetical protein
MLRRGTFIAVVVLLASASSASAECAWVLWSRSGHTSPTSSPSTSMDNYYTLNGFPSFNQCVSAGQAAAENAAQMDLPSASTRRSFALPHGGWRFTVDNPTTKAFGFTDFTCLPDTVDPRGPKGSGR